MNESNIGFRAAQGKESNIMKTEYNEGWLYFATDSKKIYLDANGTPKLPMGGNSGVYYGKLEHEDIIPEGQTEFEFTLYDIEGNDDPSRLNIPNKDDLILNIPDGCFYRVVSINGTGYDTVVATEKLTIAGGGGGGTDDPSDLGKYTLTATTPKAITILFGSEYSIGFSAEASDSSGSPTGNGTYELYVQGIKVGQGIAKQGSNILPVTEYLALGDNTIKVIVYMDRGGSALVPKSLTYSITTTEMKLVWDYNESAVQYTDNELKLEYTVGGVGIEKSVELIIDGLYPLVLQEKFTSNQKQYYTFTPTELASYNLTHGAHDFRMQAFADLGGRFEPTNEVYKTITFAERGNTAPVISMKLYNLNLTQYDTVDIPITIYSIENATAKNATVKLLEDGVEVDKWENVENFDTNRKWAYTPVTAGSHILTVQCGMVEVSKTVQVEALGIDNEEVKDYAFRFKASDFASDSAVQSWVSNDVDATFSPQFDWINGGLRSEKDEKNKNRQFIQIKAGSSMTINYPLFRTNAKSRGKTLKMIFKAKNCRDYDAKVLECKRDTKIISVDSENDIFLQIENGTELEWAYAISINEDGSGSLMNPETATFDLTNADSRNIFRDKYIELDGQFYKCNIQQVEGSGGTAEDGSELPKVYYSYWHLATIQDSFEGFVMQAQSAIFNSRNNTISTQYCEDSYIELEFDISKRDSNDIRNYIKFWIDGVPSGFVIYDKDDSFIDDTNAYITIGSQDCDVCLYMIKVYEKGLSDEEHLQNFIADAPNAEEMIDRYRRNDILDERSEISPTKLALANPDCLVHVYTLTKEGMTTTKKDKKKNCKYQQYHNSKDAVLYADNVTIKVQGTSSEKYVVAAANVDAEFENGFTDAINNTQIDGWSMDGGQAIPVNYFCTKVNVASCENANNALNQEWYDMFQPYKTVVRFKNPGARDCMQFTNGVMFMIDNNPTFSMDGNADKKKNNLFGEVTVANGYTTNYMDNPYAKMYSLANMGNSKKNIEVFHDHTNPLECCIEVTDNQEPQQWMTSDIYTDSDIDDNKEYYGFRYPDGVENATQQMKDGWRRFVSWMAHSNPQPKYEEHTANTEAEYKAFAFNQKKQEEIPTYILDSGRTEYTLSGYNPSIKTYYTLTDNVYGYTNLPLPEYELSYDLRPEANKKYYQKIDNSYSEIAISPTRNPSAEGLYEKVQKTFGNYTFRGYRCEEQKQSDGKLWQDSYTPMIAGLTIDEYANTYDRDTYQYRMAKMLSRCEDYLVMDSVIYHYLFIERHCMIDNVAKNTFWSTEDGLHWNMTKNYDNDTADGNDNNGKFTRTYGMEVLDDLNASVKVFNAHRSVWLNFIHGLYKARQHMYQQLENVTVEVDGRPLHLWSKDDYLWLFKKWQSKIPERCWIEDYYRKYFRPYELYNDTMFIEMMEGGQKSHQRRQYETYQEIYMSSEYRGSDTVSSNLTIRSNGQGMLNAPLAVEVYNDCYIHMDTGSNTTMQRVKRNEKNFFRCPTNNLNNATMYFYPAKAFSVIGSTTPGEGMVGDYFPEQISFTNAGKLRELVVSTANAGSYNESLKSGFDLLNNTMLEKLHAANLTKYEQGLNLSGCPNLIEVDATNSSFTSVQIANNAPVTSITLQNPTSLDLSNTRSLQKLEIKDTGRLSILKLNNIDNDNVSSKELVNKCGQLTNYKLTEVDWTMDNPNEINTSNNTINLLERLRKLRTIENDDETAEDPYEPIQNSLTGDLLVTGNAYNGTESFAIYDTYAQEDLYPNLDISFNGSEAKLLKVTIYDGNNSTLWTRKLNSGDNIDAAFLSDGPQGKLTIDKIYKSNTPAETFAFLGTWHMYLNEDLESEPVVIEGKDNGGLPYYNNITTDVILVPQFVSQPRYYEVKFFGTDLNEPFYTETFKFGTPYAELQPREIPYKDYSGSSLAAAWDFKGYSLVAGASNLVPEAYTLTNAQSFYAVFEFVNDIREIVHPEWFEYIEDTYVQDQSYDYTPEPLPAIKGYRIMPKVSLKGKITLPAQYNGKPIIKVGSHFASIQSSLPQEITHIFCEKGSEIREIMANAFVNNPILRHFDFSPNTVRFIDSMAFNQCTALDATNFTLSNSLWYIGYMAFTAAFKPTASPVTLKVPGSVVVVHDYGFANLNVSQGSTLYVGDSENYSNLNLALPALSDDQISKFTGNGEITTYLFYTNSSEYGSASSSINGTIYQVQNAFMYNHQIPSDGAIGTITLQIFQNKGA